MRTTLAMLLVLLLAPGVRAQQRPGEPLLGDVTRDHIRLTDAKPTDEVFPVRVNGWYGLMNRQGFLIVYPRYEWTDFAYDGFARAVADGKTGFMKGNGEWYIEPRLAHADRFSEGFAIVGDESGRFGFIDKARNVVIPIELDEALRFSEGMAAVRRGERIGFIDQRGQLAIPLQFARAGSFHEGVAMVKFPGERGAYAFIDKRGRVNWRDRDGKIEDLRGFHEGLARAKSGGKWGYLDRSHRFRIEPRFQDARDFAGGTAAVKLDGKWGFIDVTGRLVVPAKYDGAENSDAPLAPVKLNGRWGYVDRTGRVAVEPQHLVAWPFFRGLAHVEPEGRWGYIDAAGRMVWDPRDALRGFVDVRTKETGRALVDDFDPYSRIMPPPPPRPVVKPPYPPDYLYDDVLPNPWRSPENSRPAR